MDDDELINAARAGKEYAGPFLVSLHGPAMAAYCRSIAGDLSDTDREHIVANAIERAVRRIEKYDPVRAPFRAWLRPFVLHAAQDWRRDHGRLDALDPDSTAATANIAGTITAGFTTHGGGGEHDDSDASPSVIQPLIDALRDALPRLRAADQLIITMRDYEHRTPETIASLLGITPEACRQRHHRARQRLTILLRDDPRVQTHLGDTP